MTYSTSTIGAVIDRLNTELFLPAIQRPFVWNPSLGLALNRGNSLQPDVIAKLGEWVKANEKI